MRTGIDFLASLVVMVVIQAGMAEAETSDQSGLCSGRVTGATSAARTAACTALINSGKYSGKNLAIAYNNRCSWNAKSTNDAANKGAIDDCTRAIGLDPAYAKAYYNRSLAYYTRRDYDRAIQDAGEAIKREPNYFSAYDNRASAYSDKGDHDHAILDYNQSLRINPKDPISLNNRCDEFALLGQYVAARLDCDESLRIRPDHQNTLRHRAWVLLALGKFDDALADYANLLRQDARDDIGLYGRGTAKLKKGDVGGGNEDLAAARAVNQTIDKEFWRYGKPAEAK
jgi:tetratricopeptide (TPR) repeat protein